MKINVITTYSDKFVIGNNNDIPWHYEEIDKYNDAIIQGCSSNVAVMGYNTYVSKGAIKNVVNIVITTKDLLELGGGCLLENVKFVDSLGACMELCNKMMYENIFIIGGEQMYGYFFMSYYYKFLDKVYITRINKKYEGNKFFYGLEEKFYYIDVKKSDIYPEIEYRVLQYDCDLVNPEMVYLQKLQDLSISDSLIFDNELQQKIISSTYFKLKIDLSQYFPLFSVIKDVKNSILEKIFISFKDNIIDATDSMELNLIGIKPYNSTYTFSIDNNNNSLSCNVNHIKGSVLNDILCNIIFSSLLVIFIAKIKKLKPYIVNYKCSNSYFLESEKYKIEKIAWNTPDVLPILKVKDRCQCKLEDFIIDDLEFLGVKI